MGAGWTRRPAENSGRQYAEEELAILAFLFLQHGFPASFFIKRRPG